MKKEDDWSRSNRDGSSSLGDMTRSVLGLPWALSDATARQLANTMAATIRVTGAPAGNLTEVTAQMVERFGTLMGEAFRLGNSAQQQVLNAVLGATGPGSVTGAHGTPGASGGMPPIFNLGAVEKAGEFVTIGYTRGTGTFSDDKRFITLNNVIYTIDGRRNGTHQGVWERHFEKPEELLATPAQPTPPLDQPVGPVPKWPVAASTKAMWAYEEGAIYSVGPAASHLVPLPDKSFLFLVSTAQVITNGTGRYAGVYGLTQSLGATHVPAGINLFAPGSSTFRAVTLDTFRYVIVRRQPSAPAPKPTVATPASVPGIEMPAPSGRFPSSLNSRRVSVYGSSMHYVEGGSGSPILFLHGNPTWSYLWRNVMPHVLPYGQCIAPDLIGMGLSDKLNLEYRFFDHVRYLDKFIEVLNLRDITLVVHDWGSILGFYYAMRNQRKIKALVFLEALFKPYATWNDFPSSLRPTFQQFRNPSIGYQQIVEQNVFIEQLLPHSMYRQLSREEMDNYRRPFQEPGSRKVILRFADELPIEGKPADVTSAVSEYSTWLRNTKLPKLLIWATPGAITSAADVEWCNKNLQNLTTVSVGRGIHFHQEDNPDPVGQGIADWLRRLSR
jgi:haloalkane dehalogenase